MALRRIVFFAVHDVHPLDVAGPFDVFERATAIMKRKLGKGEIGYNVELVTTESDNFGEKSALKLVSDRTSSTFRGVIDTLIVVAHGADPKPPVSSAELGWLQDKATRVRRIGSICAGAFVLARAGLLDGREATTHWGLCEQLSERFPNIHVNADPIFLRDGNVYTSAGVTAGMDLALSLVEEDLGYRVALEVARGLVLFMRRPGTQAQFSSMLDLQASNRSQLRDLPAWITEHIVEKLPVERLAVQANMSPRNFARVFQQEFGATPGKFVEMTRLEMARRLLEETSDNIESVSRQSGFTDEEAMRRSFLRTLKVTPKTYRRRFGQQTFATFPTSNG